MRWLLLLPTLVMLTGLTITLTGRRPVTCFGGLVVAAFGGYMLGQMTVWMAP